MELKHTVEENNGKPFTFTVTDSLDHVQKIELARILDNTSRKYIADQKANELVATLESGGYSVNKLPSKEEQLKAEVRDAEGRYHEVASQKRKFKDALPAILGVVALVTFTIAGHSYGRGVEDGIKSVPRPRHGVGRRVIDALLG